MLGQIEQVLKKKTEERAACEKMEQLSGEQTCVGVAFATFEYARDACRTHRVIFPPRNWAWALFDVFCCLPFWRYCCGVGPKRFSWDREPREAGPCQFNKDGRLEAELCPEVKDINWENLHVSRGRLRISGAVTDLVTLLCCLVSLSAVFFIKLYRRNESSNDSATESTLQRATGYLLGAAMGVVTTFANWLAGKIVQVLTSRQSQHTNSALDSAVIRRSVRQRILNGPILLWGLSFYTIVWNIYSTNTDTENEAVERFLSQKARASRLSWHDR